MANKVRHEDGRAIDLFLDRGSLSAALGSTVVKNGKHNIRGRLLAAERVLRVLDHLEVSEPSPDLVSRTLKRIDDAPLSPAAHVQPAMGQFHSARPHV